MKNETENAVIYCDAAENTVHRTVNRFGKKLKFDNGGYRVGLVLQIVGQEDVEAIYHNTQCPDQFAGECWAVLKAIELAKENRLAAVTIRNDPIGSFKATTKKGYKGSTYLWLAEKIARENNIEVEFDTCTSSENIADGLSRREGAPQGIQKPRSQVAAEKQIASSFENSTTVPDGKVAARSDRGPEFAAFFEAHKDTWPAMRDAWKAEGLSSKARDLRLQAAVKEWAAVNFKPTA